MKRFTPLTATYRRRGGNPQEVMWHHPNPMMGAAPSGATFDTTGPYIDVYGTQQGGVYVTAQTGDTTLEQFDTTTGSSAAGQYAAHINARYWYDGNESIGWEVGRKRQIIYHTGKRFDLTAIIGSDKTIRAGCFLGTPNKPRLLLKDEVGDFSIVDLTWNATDEKYEIVATYTYGVFSRTQRLGEDSDVRHLYSAFMNTGVIVAVVLRQDKTEVQLCQVNWTALQAGLETTWGTGTETYTLSSAGVTASINARKTPANTSVINSGIGGNSNVVISNTVLSKGQNITDNVALTGKRVVSCSSTSSRLALLVETINTTCHRRVNKPVYASGEYYWTQVRPIVVGGFPFGWNYDWEIKLDGFDSGKLSERWERTAANNYKRLVFDLQAITGGDGKLLGYQLTWPDESVFLSGGTFSSVSQYYERFALPDYQVRVLNHPVVPPLQDMTTAFRATMYSETKWTYERAWDKSVKFYACDPARDIYVYQLIENGLVEFDFLEYEQAGFAHPDPADLDCRDTFEGTVALILRYWDTNTNQYVDKVLDSRPLREEIGKSLSLRYDMNSEPTMPYYTQEQPNLQGAADWDNTESKLLNLSINIGFDGRHLATDPDKTGAAIQLALAQDRPSSTSDDRYKYFTDGALFALQTSIPKDFFEAYRPCVFKNNNINAQTPFVPSAPLDIDFRLFEDRHRLVCNLSTPSGEVTVPVYKRPPEWPDIRGWWDFRNRGYFGDRDNMPMLKFFVPSRMRRNPPLDPIVDAVPQDAPPITVVTDI